MNALPIHRLILPASLLVFLVAATGCRRQQPQHQMPPRPVTVTKVVKENVPLYLEEIGNCVAVESVNIQPQATGKIMEIHFMDGADLKKGDKLFTIDPRPYQAELDRAEAALQRAQATLVINKAQYDRSKELAGSNYISPQNYETLKTAVDTSEADVKSSEANVATAKINLEYCYIKSPIEGRAGVRLIDAGNVVTANSGTSLLSVQRMDPMYVDFIVPELDLPKVREYLGTGKLNVNIFFADDEKKSRIGDLFFVDNTVQTGTGTVKLRAILENKDRLFWPGQFVRVRIILRELPDSLLVPYSAVQISQQGPYVFMVGANDTAEMRMVKLGQRQGDRVVIKEGVKEGETVIAGGQLFVGPGSKVAIVQPQAAGGQGAGHGAAAGKPNQQAAEGNKTP